MIVPRDKILSKRHPQSGLFLQSKDWGKFQKKFGREVERLHPFESGGLGEGVLVVYMPLPFGLRYAYIPRGADLIKRKWGGLLDRLKERDVVFVRIEPLSRFRLRDYRARLVKEVQPSATRMLDLRFSEQDLLKQMKQKTRYNIRLAERKEVEVKEVGVDGLDDFLRLIGMTAERQNIKMHSKEYYRKMVRVLLSPSVLPQKDRCEVRIFFAKYYDEILAVNLVLTYGNTVTYLHGGTSDKFRNIMAPHLLQWHIIKWAKKNGFSWYDFWGVAPAGSEQKRHPLAGVSRFKEGFGGQIVEYPGTFEIPFRKFWYLLIKVYRIFRR